MNKRTIDTSKPNRREAITKMVKNKVAVGLLSVTAAIVILVLGIASTIQAQTSTITVAAGETLEVLCEGQGFKEERLSRTHLRLVCVPPRNPGNPTEPPPQPTNTSQPPLEATNTPVSPTTTPPPPPPGDGPIAPYAGAPGCEEVGLVHDPYAWHGIWDYEHGCHWDHEHKHDPDEVADIFGPAGTWFGGSGISYPWQTSMENEHKHEAYSWIVRRDIPSHGREVWIKDFRLQVHVTSAPFTMPDGTLHGGYLGRFHSYSLEAQVCNQVNECGIVRTGGWLDFGHLEISDINPCVDLHQDPSQQETCGSTGRRRIHYYHTDTESTTRDDARASFFWYGRQGLPNDVPPILNPLAIAVATGDASVNVDPNNPYSFLPFCPERNCNKNDSTVQGHVVQFEIRPDSMNFNGYTNRHGALVEGCTAARPDCIPLIIEHAPAGRVQHRDDRDLGLSVLGVRDFDLSPPGEWWIKYPN